MANNFKVSGKKMTSRFWHSHKAINEAVKNRFIPSAAEAKAYGRDPSYSAKQWRKLQRMSLRQSRVHQRGRPVYDMDGGYYHG